LVYTIAFAPDKGESVSSLIKDPSPGAPVPPILPPSGWMPFPRQRQQGGFMMVGAAYGDVGGVAAGC
jgi:hypothetical protein